LDVGYWCCIAACNDFYLISGKKLARYEARETWQVLAILAAGCSVSLRLIENRQKSHKKTPKLKIS
jgi:hypothetical protein